MVLFSDYNGKLMMFVSKVEYVSMVLSLQVYKHKRQIEFVVLAQKVLLYSFLLKWFSAHKVISRNKILHEAMDYIATTLPSSDIQI